MFPFIAAAFSAVVSFVSSIGPAVAGFCTNVLPKILPLLEKGIQVFGEVEKVANTVTQVLGIFNDNETTENIGDRAIQAAEKGIKPDQFGSHAFYMNALREFKLDPEKNAAENMTIPKIASGLAVAGRGLDEKFGTPEGTMSNLWWLTAIKPEYFDANKLTQFAKTGQDVTSIFNYFEGKLGTGASLRVEDKLVELDKISAPDQDEKSIRSKIYAAAEAVQKQD